MVREDNDGIRAIQKPREVSVEPVSVRELVSERVVQTQVRNVTPQRLDDILLVVEGTALSSLAWRVRREI